MKNLIIISLVLLTISSFSQVPVEDKYTRYQIEREVYRRWNKFKPKAYYNAFHKKYKKGGDKRNLLQLSPTLGAVKKNNKESKDQAEETKEVADYMAAQQANIIAEKPYHLHYKKEFKRLESMYDDLTKRCIQEKVDFTTMQAFKDEKAMLDNYLEVVRKGNIPPGESTEAFKEIQFDFRRLVACMDKAQKLYRVKNKYATIKIDQ